MSLKSVTVNCLVGGVAFFAGLLIGGVSADSGPLVLPALIGSTAVAIYAAIRTAADEGKWMDEHANTNADTGTPPEDNDPYSIGYDAGYIAGFDDAAESLQFARPPRERKPGHRGA